MSTEFSESNEPVSQGSQDNSIWRALNSKPFFIASGLASIVSCGLAFLLPASIRGGTGAQLTVVGVAGILAFLVAYLFAKRLQYNRLTPEQLHNVHPRRLLEPKEISEGAYSSLYPHEVLKQQTARIGIDSVKVVLFAVLAVAVVALIVWAYTLAGAIDSEKSLMIRENAELLEKLSSLPNTLSKSEMAIEAQAIGKLLLIASSQRELDALRERQLAVETWYAMSNSNFKHAAAVLPTTESDQAKLVKTDALLWSGQQANAKELVSTVKSPSIKSELAELRVELAGLENTRGADKIAKIKFLATENRLRILRLDSLTRDLDKAYQIDAISYQLILLGIWFSEVTADGVVQTNEYLSSNNSILESTTIDQYLAYGHYLIDKRQTLEDGFAERQVPLSERVRINGISAKSNWAQGVLNGLLSLSDSDSWSEEEVDHYTLFVSENDKQLLGELERYCRSRGSEAVIEFAELFRQISMRSYARVDYELANMQMEAYLRQLKIAGEDGKFLGDNERIMTEVAEALVHIGCELNIIENEKLLINRSTYLNLFRWCKVITGYANFSDFDATHPTVWKALYFCKGAAERMADMDSVEKISNELAALSTRETVSQAAKREIEALWKEFVVNQNTGISST